MGICGVVIAEDATRILVFYDKANLLPKFFFLLFAPALFAAFNDSSTLP
jgi:hypothetical protein